MLKDMCSGGGMKSGDIVASVDFGPRGGHAYFKAAVAASVLFHLYAVVKLHMFSRLRDDLKTGVDSILGGKDEQYEQ